MFLNQYFRCAHLLHFNLSFPLMDSSSNGSDLMRERSRKAGWQAAAARGSLTLFIHRRKIRRPRPQQKCPLPNPKFASFSKFLSKSDQPLFTTAVNSNFRTRVFKITTEAKCLRMRHVRKRGPDKRCKMAELPTLDKRRVSKTELNEKIKKRESDLKTQTKGCNESHNSCDGSLLPLLVRVTKIRHSICTTTFLMVKGPKRPPLQATISIPLSHFSCHFHQLVSP